MKAFEAVKAVWNFLIVNSEDFALNFLQLGHENR